MPFGVAIIAAQVGALHSLMKAKQNALERGDTEMAAGYDQLIKEHCDRSIVQLKQHRQNRENAAQAQKIVDDAIAQARAKAVQHAEAMIAVRKLPPPRLITERSYWPWLVIGVLCWFGWVL